MTAPWEWADRPPVWGKGRREPQKLSRLRHKLHQKAKQEPKFRFCTLYNHLLRQDVLETAWAQVRRNDGAPGVDGESLDFLGFTLQYHRDLKGRDHRYLHVMPSKKAMARERAKLRQMTDSRYCFKPIPALIRELNRNLRGWANYFDYGHPRRRFREINWYVRQRLKFHLRRRSQRPFRPPKGVTFYKHLATIGLDSL